MLRLNYVAHHAQALRHAVAVGSQRADAEDAAQDAALALLTADRSGTKLAKLRKPAYTNTVLRNGVLRSLVKARKAARTSENFEESPCGVYSEDRRSDELRAELAHVAPLKRLVALLHHGHNISTRDIGRIAAKHHTTVSAWIRSVSVLPEGVQQPRRYRDHVFAGIRLDGTLTSFAEGKRASATARIAEGVPAGEMFTVVGSDILTEEAHGTHQTEKADSNVGEIVGASPRRAAGVRDQEPLEYAPAVGAYSSARVESRRLESVGAGVGNTATSGFVPGGEEFPSWINPKVIRKLSRDGFDPGFSGATQFASSALAQRPSGSATPGRLCDTFVPSQRRSGSGVPARPHNDSRYPDTLSEETTRMSVPQPPHSQPTRIPTVTDNNPAAAQQGIPQAPLGNPLHPQQGHPQQGHPQQGHPQQGHPQHQQPQASSGVPPSAPGFQNPTAPMQQQMAPQPTTGQPPHAPQPTTGQPPQAPQSPTVQPPAAPAPQQMAPQVPTAPQAPPAGQPPQVPTAPQAPTAGQPPQAPTAGQPPQAPTSDLGVELDQIWDDEVTSSTAPTPAPDTFAPAQQEHAASADALKLAALRVYLVDGGFMSPTQFDNPVAKHTAAGLSEADVFKKMDANVKRRGLRDDGGNILFTSWKEWAHASILGNLSERHANQALTSHGYRQAKGQHPDVAALHAAIFAEVGGTAPPQQAPCAEAPAAPVEAPAAPVEAPAAPVEAPAETPTASPPTTVSAGEPPADDLTDAERLKKMEGRGKVFSQIDFMVAGAIEKSLEAITAQLVGEIVVERLSKRLRATVDESLDRLLGPEPETAAPAKKSGRPRKKTTRKKAAAKPASKNPVGRPRKKKASRKKAASRK